MSRSIQLNETSWQPNCDETQQTHSIESLESGKVVFFPQLRFELTDEEWACLDSKTIHLQAKNVSFNPRTQRLKGVEASEEITQLLANLCQRFHAQANQLIHSMFAPYVPFLEVGMTTLRPVEIEGRRPLSPKKDDRKIHVDAFPSRPNQGRRILRVFSNIHRLDRPRVWRVGEPFADLAQKFVPHIKPAFPGWAKVLKWTRLTKGLRTPYDHLMLNLHDRMKADTHYQQTVDFEEIAFPPGSTWIVFSDSVSHAVLSGQHMMEQTFYLPVEGMKDPKQAPFHILKTL